MVFASAGVDSTSLRGRESNGRRCFGRRVPQAQQTARGSASFGCAGNRVYTGASETEGSYAIPGAALALIEAKLEVVTRANAELKKFHEARNAELS